MKTSDYKRIRDAERKIEQRALMNLYRDMMRHEPGDVAPAGEDERVVWMWFILVLVVVIGVSAWMLVMG